MHYTAADGIPTGSIFGLMAALDGTLWLAGDQRHGHFSGGVWVQPAAHRASLLWRSRRVSL